MSEKLHIRDTRNGDWFFIHNVLIEKFGEIIGVYGIAVYSVLAMYANNATQETFPSYATIAKSIGCSRRKVISVIDNLAKHNIIGKTTRQGTNGVYDSNVIILLHKDEWGSAQRSLPEVVNGMHHPPSEQDAPGVVNQVHGGSESGAPKQDSVNKTQDSLSNDNESAEPEQPQLLNPQDTLDSDTSECHLLFEKLTVEYRAKGRRAPKKFPTLACKRKFLQAADKLNGTLEKAIGVGLENNITKIPNLVNYISSPKWQNGGKKDGYGSNPPKNQKPTTDPASRLSERQLAALRKH